MKSIPKAFQGDYIQSLLAKKQMSALEPYLQAHHHPVVHLERGQQGSQQLGASRIGGYPDLPKHMKWPLTQDGEYMTSVAQLNLAQIAKEVGEDRLPDYFPRQGLLYFFVGLDEPSYQIEHQIIYISEPEIASIAYREPEATTILEEEAEQAFVPYEVHAQGNIEFPTYSYVDYDQLANYDISDEQYLEWKEQVNAEPDDMVGKIFGYPVSSHGDDYMEAATAIFTGKHTYDMDKRRKWLVKQCDGNEQQADREIEDTLMLLEIESDDDIGYMWWDAGVIHFFIRKEDLIQLNFDRTYCSVYSS
ncbi:YwqG family protein [Paenibacillus nicotianae]|uniref:YwqG family protein n=1 Tax=Paenibacillus nicotianae TaxID=1526551 RepID=A0ABW4UWR3_9BACL